MKTIPIQNQFSVFIIAKSIILILFYKKCQIAEYYKDINCKRQICYEFTLQLRKYNPVIWIIAFCIGIPTLGFIGLPLVLDEIFKDVTCTKVILHDNENLKWWYGFENFYQ